MAIEDTEGKDQKKKKDEIVAAQSIHDTNDENEHEVVTKPKKDEDYKYTFRFLKEE